MKERVENLQAEALQRVKSGDGVAAAAIIAEALRLQPGDPESLQIAGSIALLTGQFAVACDYLGQAHAVAPQAGHILANYLEALLRAGNPALAQGLAAAAGQDFPDWLPGKVFLARAWAAQAAWPEAAMAWAAVVACQPESVPGWQGLAEAEAAAGNWLAAAAAWRQLLPLLPDQSGLILCNQGNAALNAGDLAEAAACLSRAVSMAPDLAAAWLNFARYCLAADRCDEAWPAFARACALAPTLPAISLTWGEAWLAHGQVVFPPILRSTVEFLAQTEAAACLLLAKCATAASEPATARRWWRAALALPGCAPNLAAEAWTNLGQQALAEKNLPAAEASLQAALACAPDAPLAWYNLGVCRHLADDYPGALMAYRRALAVTQPDAHWYVPLLANLGRAHFDQGDLAAARACLESAGAGEAVAHQLFGNYVEVLLRQADWTALTGVLAQAGEGWAERVNPFTALALVDDPCAHWRAARAYAQEVMPQAQPWRPGRGWQRGRRLRVAYLSSDLHAHATAYLLADVLASHDRQQIEVFAYSFGPDDGSAMRQRLQAGVEHFRDLHGVQPREMAAAIRRDGIDILVDLKGYTHRALPEVLASRPAPVQVNWLGFPGSMASAAIDYIVVDRFICPPEKSPRFTVDREPGEFPVCLSGCYQPADRAQQVGDPGQRQDWGLPTEGFVFASFNQVYKLSATVFAQWCQIVSACPDSVLWMFEPEAAARAELTARWQAHGLAVERLCWAAVCPHPEHLARLRHVDLMLDTYPYGAHTTASDALRQSVPVLTHAGCSFPSRVAGSLLWHLGLPELICADWTAYVAQAIQLYSAPGELAGLRQRLQAALPRLLDAPGMAAELEAAYLAMAERQQQGLPPTALLAGRDFPALMAGVRAVAG